MAHMAARNAAGAPLGVFAPRTIFVRASPAPLTFAERRAVLHALKRHCRIDFFRKIKNHPSSFLSLAESREAAQSLIAKSPLTYQLAVDAAAATEPDTPTTPSDERAEPADQDIQTNDPPQETSSTPTGAKNFIIHIFPRQPGTKHAHLVQDSPLFGPWPSPPDATSFAARNLRFVIPEGEARDGLADWETGGQLREDGDLGEGEARGPGYYVGRRRQRRWEERTGLSGVLGGA